MGDHKRSGLPLALDGLIIATEIRMQLNRTEFNVLASCSLKTKFSSWAHVFGHSVPSWQHCFGRLKKLMKWGLSGGYRGLQGAP